MPRAEGALDLEQTLHERFGLERFRPGQREVIEQVLQGRDVLCVMPTGGGKSLCYQLPALRLEGLTLVVSPLIALMKDQVDALRERGLRATFINSTLDPAEQQLRLREVEAGSYDLVYVAPERFRSGRFVQAMKRVRLALLAVDEAHCISEWGHDFRPDYARLGYARKQLGSPPCIALTATATDLVRRDIADQLDLHEPAEFVTGFDRPNLVYSTVSVRRDADKLAALADVFDRNLGSAIVYVSSRARCEIVTEFVERELRRSAVIYHAGLTREERATAQDRFMSGDAQVVAATNAFGMGVDKADVRAVVHFNMPGTLEAYYQEAGRAGRDGLPAECVLLYAVGDRFLQEMFIENEYPPPDAVYRVYDVLRRREEDPIELTQAEIKVVAKLELAEQAVGSILKILEGAGALERFRPRENMAIVRINAEPDEPSLVERLSPQANVQRVVLAGLEGLVGRRFNEPIYFHPDLFCQALGLDRPALARALRHLTAELPLDYVPPFRGNAVRILDPDRPARDLAIDFTHLNTRKDQEYAKLERMIEYAQTSRCRRAFILGYFGDQEATRCGRCDNCSEAPADSPATVVIDTDAGREVVLKVLSGVARTKGRFGKITVAQMLTGSNSEKVARWGLTRLSTFGLLAEFRQAEVIEILDALTVVGLVESEDVDRFRPIVSLTEEGWRVLKSQTDQEIALPLAEPLATKVRFGGLARLAPRQATPSEPSPHPAGGAKLLEPPGSELANGPMTPVADPLADTLRALRTTWAREAAMPAYVIFNNQTLDELVRLRPRTPHELAAIKGFGPARLEKYGAALLDVIQRAGAGGAPASAVGKRSSGATLPPATPSVPTEHWTWLLLDRGFTAAEAAAIRGLDLAAIIRHATVSAKAGNPVPLAAFFASDLLARLEQLATDPGCPPPPPEIGVPPELWALYLACRPEDSHEG